MHTVFTTISIIEIEKICIIFEMQKFIRKKLVKQKAYLFFNFNSEFELLKDILKYNKGCKINFSNSDYYINLFNYSIKLLDIQYLYQLIYILKLIYFLKYLLYYIKKYYILFKNLIYLFRLYNIIITF